MNNAELNGRILNEIKILYQNYEQEGINEYMPLIKEIINVIQPYTTSGNSEVQVILQSIQRGVEAYKHSDIIGMADSLMIVGDNIKYL